MREVHKQELAIVRVVRRQDAEPALEVCKAGVVSVWAGYKEDAGPAQEVRREDAGSVREVRK